MERTETLTAATAPRHELPGSYIDWPAVFGGAVVATATAGLFTAFGAALGLSTISAEPGEGSFNLLLVVTALWIVVTLVASYLAGGYIVGRMRRRLDDASADEVAARDGINGLVVWGLGTLVSAWMAAGVIGATASAVGSAASAVGSAAGTVVQTAGSAVGTVAQTAGSALGAAAGGVADAVSAAVPEGAGEDALAYISDTLVRPALGGAQQGVQLGDGFTTPTTPAADPAELSRQTGAILANVLRTGEISEDEEAFLRAATAQITGLSEAEVEARVEQAIEGAQEVRAEVALLAEEAQAEAERLAEEARAEAERLAAEAEEAAIQAAETARQSAILTAFLLTAATLVAAAAAVIGAVRGGRHRDEGRLFGGFSYRI